MSKRLSYEPLSPRARAAYHRQEVLVHQAAGYSSLAQWHHEMAEWLDPTPRIRPERTPRRSEVAPEPRPVVRAAQVQASSTVRQDRVQRINSRTPAGTRVASQGPGGRVLARRGVA